MKFCTSCEHYRDGYGLLSDNCRRPTTDRRSPVNGEFLDRLNTEAAGERKVGRTLFGRERCGPEATFFKAKGWS